MSFVSTVPASTSAPTLPSTPASVRLQVRLRHLHALRLSSPLPRPTFQNRFCHRSPVVRALPQRPLTWPHLAPSSRRRLDAANMPPVAVRKSHLHPQQALPPRSPRPLHVAKRLSVDDVTRFARLRFLPRLARRARRSLLVAEHRPRVASPRWALRARSCGGPLSCLPLGRPSSDKPNHEFLRWPSVPLTPDPPATTQSNFRATSAATHSLRATPFPCTQSTRTPPNCLTQHWTRSRMIAHLRHSQRCCFSTVEFLDVPSDPTTRAQGQGNPQV